MTNCPNCGAPFMEIGRKCEYCGTPKPVEKREYNTRIFVEPPKIKPPPDWVIMARPKLIFD